MAENKFPNHKLEFVHYSNNIQYFFRKKDTSHEAINVLVMNEKTFITGDWGDWILCRPIDLDKPIDRHYLKTKITAQPVQQNKTGLNFWFDQIMDGLEVAQARWKEGLVDKQYV